MHKPRCLLWRRVTLLSPASDDTTFHAKSQSIHNNWLSPTSQKDFHIKIDTWKLSLGGGAKRELHLTDGWMGLNLSFPPKKGRLFGKSRASDFVRRIPGNTLLTKVLNYYFDLNFCRQWIYQWQFRICDNCHLNIYCFNFAKLFQWKSLEGLWQASWIWEVAAHLTI